jgi:virulence-associated protein VapD
MRGYWRGPRRIWFHVVQGSLYLTDEDDLANLFAAILALKALPWFPPSLRDLRAFEVEHWSDFTPIIKS